jgi:hypothetical protein
MHKQVRIKPNGGFGFNCDEGIADILFMLNKNQINTCMSCQDFDNHVLIYFDDIAGVNKLHEIARKLDDHQLFNFLVRRDLRLKFGYDEESENGIQYTIRFNFPKEDLDLFKPIFFSAFPLEAFKIYEIRQTIKLSRMTDEDY